MNELYQRIIDTPLPAFRANIRDRARKEWSKEVRKLLKSIGLGFVSVTTPSYSMASSIDIRFHQDEGFREGSAHEAQHVQIDRSERGSNIWHGYGYYCPYCQQQWQAHQRLEKIILAAFPDLDDRSDSQSDYFDSCLSIQ